MAKKVKTKPAGTLKMLNSDWLSRRLLFAGLLILLILLLVQNQYESFGRRLAAYPNQACSGVAAAQNAAFTFPHYEYDISSEAGPFINTHSAPAGYVGSQRCFVGTVITNKTTNSDGSGSASGYQLGASVQYFKDSSSAHNFAEKSMNLEHSWSPDPAGVSQGIQQTSLFTFIETKTAEPYVEGYTVRDKVVLEFTLPCTAFKHQDPNTTFSDCDAAAKNVLRTYADSVQNKLRTDPL